MHYVNKNETIVTVQVTCSECGHIWNTEYGGGIGIESAEEYASEEKCPGCGC
jgi:hypothetical protein